MTGPAPDWSAQLRELVAAAAGLLTGLTTATAPHVGTPHVGTPHAGAPDAGTGPSATVPADHSAECRTCPVCTALAVLRGRRPDLSEALADVLATAATALRAHARPEETTPGHPAPEPEPHEEQVSPSPPPAPVQHIEVA